MAAPSTSISRVKVALRRRSPDRPLYTLSNGRISPCAVAQGEEMG